MSPLEVFQKQQKKALELRGQSVKSRRKLLKNLEKWVLAHRMDIQNALFEDFKKVPEETDLMETYVVLTEIREARKHLDYWARREYVKPSLPYLGTSAYIQYEPKGVCLIIAPWNFPFQLAVAPLVSAIAAGNTCILKPSEFTPATSALLKQMCDDVFDADHVAVFEGDREVATELLKLPFNHIFFTGSPAVGKIVMEAAAKHLSSITLELGGKSPVFIDETAKITDTAQKIAWAKWANAGQTCTAPDYILVHKSRQQELLRELKSCAEKLYPGANYMTHIVNESHENRLTAWLKEAVDKGANLDFGGKKEDYFSPTVIHDVPEEATLVQEEIFGPILLVKAYDTLEEAIKYVNEKPKPLSLYVFSKSKKNKKAILTQTSSGSVAVNDAVIQFGHPELPFGGVNNSGFGKSHGRYGFKAFSNEKSVLKQRIGFTMAKTLYPPYSGLKMKMINLLLKYF